MRRALYLNKFGIMHKGLVSLVEDISDAQDIDELVLGVCSSQFSDMDKSPQKQGIYNCLDGDERERVMRASLSHIGKPIRYVQIPDFMPIDKSMPENPWIDYVIESVPYFQVLYSERDTERICMEHRGKEIRDVPKNVAFSDHCIRDKMARGEVWQPFFTPEAAQLLQQLDIEDRYRKLYEEYEMPGKTPEDFEWRTFNPSQRDIDAVLSLPKFDEKEVNDQYIVSLVRSAINMKLRPGVLKVKELLKSVGGIEQYASQYFNYPGSRDGFRSFCRSTRFPMIPGLSEGFSEGDVVSSVPDFPNPYLMLVQVNKKRMMRLYECDGVRVGVDVNYLNVLGRDAVSIGIDAKTEDHARFVRESLGLSGRPMNYVQFLERELVREHGDEIFENMWVG